VDPLHEAPWLGVLRFSFLTCDALVQYNMSFKSVIYNPSFLK